MGKKKKKPISFQENAEKALFDLALKEDPNPLADLLDTILENLEGIYEPDENGEVPVAVYDGKGRKRFLAVSCPGGEVKFYLFFIDADTPEGETKFLLGEPTLLGMRPVQRSWKKKIN